MTCTWKHGFGRHCVQKKPFMGECIYGITWKHTLLTISFISNTLFLYYYYHWLFSLFYISLVVLLLLPKLIFSSYLSVLFIIMIYKFVYFTNSLVIFGHCFIAVIILIIIAIAIFILIDIIVIFHYYHVTYHFSHTIYHKLFSLLSVLLFIGLKL